MTSPRFVRAPVLGAAPHGFFGRSGGVSTGAMSSLNAGLGSGDDPDSILRNRRVAADCLMAGASVITPYQIHSAEAVHARGPWQGAPAQADGLVTATPGILLGIVTADCAPILFVDGEAGVVGAAHAGWRGAFAGIIEATMAAMERLGARRAATVAAIGPCIALASYQVDEDFRSHFLDQDPDNARFFERLDDGRPHFDLQAYVGHRLRTAGIGSVETLDIDTYSRPADYFSYRRSTHLGEPSYGRQISLIGLPAERS